MKKLISISFFFFAIAINAQVITSNPVFFNVDTENLQVIFDASLGNRGLQGYVGNEIFAHTGVITTQSTSNSDWRHATPSWGDNSERFRLTRLEGETDKWVLTLSPSIRGYYGLNPGEEVIRLAFVFRNRNSTQAGRDDGGTDIFLDIPSDGLAILFQNPIRNRFYSINDTVDIRFVASQYADLSLHINNTEVHRINNVNEFTHTHIFSAGGNFELTAKAETATETTSETIRIFVPMATIDSVRPAHLNLRDGINYIDNNTVGLVKFAPRTPSFSKENIFVIGDFNDWEFSANYQMFRESHQTNHSHINHHDSTYWWIIITDLHPDTLYGFQYSVDNDRIRVTDPYTRLILDPWNDRWINEHFEVFPNLPPYPTGKTTGLVSTFQINKPQFEWQSGGFKIENTQNLVIYEMLFRDFTEEGSFRAAMEKLDYLQELGITAVKLLPVMEFDGNDSWGYNPNHFFALDKAYGSVEMFKRFIDECHKREIAVILDIVPNHATGSHPWAALYWDGANNRTAPENPFFNVSAPHQWSVFHDFDHSHPKVREHFRRAFQFWAEEFRIDGFRFDLSKGITQGNYQGGYRPGNCPPYGDDSWCQDRIDWLTEYYHAALDGNPNIMFILEHFAHDPEERELASRGMYLWRHVNHEFGQAIMGRQSGSSFARLNSNPRRWIGYAESHDEERNFYRARTHGLGNLQTDSVARLARVPLQTAFVVLMPGPKMLWQFGEFGYDIHINYNGRTGRKPIPWGWLEGEERQRALVGSAKSINLRKQFPRAFTEGAFSFNIASNHWNEGRRIALSHGDLEMIALGNFRVDGVNGATGEIQVAPRFPKSGVWYELMSGAELYIQDVDTVLTMNAGKLWIFTDRRIELSDDLRRFDNPDAFVDARPERPFVNSIVTDWININTQSVVERVVVYDVSGKVIIDDRSGANQVDASRLPSGMYIVSVWSSAGVMRQKIIKQTAR